MQVFKLSERIIGATADRGNVLLRHDEEVAFPERMNIAYHAKMFRSFEDVLEGESLGVAMGAGFLHDRIVSSSVTINILIYCQFELSGSRLESCLFMYHSPS